MSHPSRGLKLSTHTQLAILTADQTMFLILLDSRNKRFRSQNSNLTSTTSTSLHADFTRSKKRLLCRNISLMRYEVDITVLSFSADSSSSCMTLGESHHLPGLSCTYLLLRVKQKRHCSQGTRCSPWALATEVAIPGA